MMMHIDDGVLSVSSEGIIHDIGLTESQLGMIEAAMYIGIIIGSLVCPFLFTALSPKLLLIGAVLFNSLAVSGWAFTQSFYLLSGFRVINGIFLVSNLSYILLKTCPPNSCLLL